MSDDTTNIRTGEEATEEKDGVFFQSLVRSNKQIKKDRAEAISEDAQIRFQRTVQDMELEMKRVKRQRENMLDMSPENAHSLILGKDFDAVAFVEKDLELGVKMHNLNIKLEIAKERYRYLFGKEQ